MFWRFGGYTTISAVDTILEKPDVSLEELLDESELIQELRQHNTKLIEYLREDNILKRLMDYVIAPSLLKDDGDCDDDAGDSSIAREGKSTACIGDMQSNQWPTAPFQDLEEKAEGYRLKRAYVSCEVLSSEVWSILESIMLNREYLRNFWFFLRMPPPLDSTQAGYFTKINETLFDKKTEEMLEFFKSLDDVVPAILQHVDNPMVMDLLLKIISLEKVEGGQGIADWLKSKGLVTSLLSLLGPEHPISVQTSAGDFLKAVITISANATQSDQSCIGPNSLTRELVSAKCVDILIKTMLSGGNSLTVGVGIVIEVIRKNNSDYDPEPVDGPNSLPTTYDPIYLGTLLRLFALHIPDFMSLIRSSTHTVRDNEGVRSVERAQLGSASGGKFEPLGFDRFKTCELMAELLHCSNMSLLNEPGSDNYIQYRDAQRDRLLREEALYLQREDTPGVDYNDSTADLANGSALYSGSVEDFKVLEVTNATEEDVFEDVSVPNIPVRTPGATDNKSENTLTPRTGFRLVTDLQGNHPNRGEPEGETSEHTVSTEASDLFDPQSPTAQGITIQTSHIKLNEGYGSAGQSQNENQETAPLLPSRWKLPTLSSTHVTVQPQPEDSPTSQSRPETAEMSSKAREDTEVAPREDKVITEPAAKQSVEGQVEQISPNVQLDPSGTPVVGDYLKIMFVQNQVVPTILGFFFRFPWNNFLHNVVYDIIQQALNGSMERGYNRSLALDLFETGRVTAQIVEGQRRSDEAQRTKHIRLGYMGHLTLIAEEVVKFSERHPPEMLSEAVMRSVFSQEWIDYVEQTLSETRERDSAVLGGVRPELPTGHRQSLLNATAPGHTFDTSAGLSETGLNDEIGGSDARGGFDTINPENVSSGIFSLGGGNSTQLSGFTSSSDDEDEEMEDLIEEQIQGSPAAECEIENTISHSESQSIPILPPPPAALSTGPSRARLQLAARLAQAKQQSIDTDRNGKENQQSSDSQTADFRWPQHQFVLAGYENRYGQDNNTITRPSVFSESGFSPPESLTSNSSDGDNGGGHTAAKNPHDYEGEDEDDMGEMVGPSVSSSCMLDSDDEDEAIINESLGYPSLTGRYNTEGPAEEEEEDSSDGEDLVEILTPRKSPSPARPRSKPGQFMV